MGVFTLAPGQTLRMDNMTVGVSLGGGTVGELILNDDGTVVYEVRDYQTSDVVYRVASIGPIFSMPPGPVDENGRVTIGDVTGNFQFFDAATGLSTPVGTLTGNIWRDVLITETGFGSTYRIDLSPETLGSIFPFFMGDDTVTLGDGGDVFYDYGGNLQASLGGGNDEAWLYEAAGAPTYKVLDAGDGNDTIYYQGGDGEIYGGRGHDLIGSQGGSDGTWVFNGGRGRDTIEAFEDSRIEDNNRSGNDQYTSTGSSNVTLSYARATGGVVVDLGNQSAVGVNTGTDFVAGIRFVEGSRGDDVMIGQVFSDGFGSPAGVRFLGLGGNDLLVGGTADDTLLGGPGNDTIIGGTGADILNGGAGADVFVYNDASDSTAARAGRDLIRGFNAAEDVIDLSAIDARPNTPFVDDAFTFLGTDAFTGRAQVRYEHVGNATVVKMNIEGNLRPEMRIDIAGLHLLTEDNFLL